MDLQFFSQFQFHPVIVFPDHYEVLDLSCSGPETFVEGYSVGRYDEDRSRLYTSEQFLTNARTIHMGLDLGAPAGTPVHSFYDAEVFLFGRIDKQGDYGPTLILKYKLKDRDLYALYGHLSLSSIENKKVGQKIKKGEIIAWVGDKEVNGGWPPHVHFQLSLQQPTQLDIPGVVSKEERHQALATYPDPRLVLGPLY